MDGGFFGGLFLIWCLISFLFALYKQRLHVGFVILLLLSEYIRLIAALFANFFFW